MDKPITLIQPSPGAVILTGELRESDSGYLRIIDSRITLNDVVIEAPNLEALLSIQDSYDGVPAMFDHKTTIEDGEVTHENLLATTKTITIPDGFKAVSGVKDDISTKALTFDVIEVVPEDGVYFDSSWIYSYGSGRTEGSYYYFDENGEAQKQLYLLKVKGRRFVELEQ